MFTAQLNSILLWAGQQAASYALITNRSRAGARQVRPGTAATTMATLTELTGMMASLVKSKESVQAVGQDSADSATSASSTILGLTSDGERLAEREQADTAHCARWRLAGRKHLPGTFLFLAGPRVARV